MHALLIFSCLSICCHRIHLNDYTTNVCARACQRVRVCLHSCVCTCVYERNRIDCQRVKCEIMRQTGSLYVSVKRRYAVFLSLHLRYQQVSVFGWWSLSSHPITIAVSTHSHRINSPMETKYFLPSAKMCCIIRSGIKKNIFLTYFKWIKIF